MPLAQFFGGVHSEANRSYKLIGGTFSLWGFWGSRWVRSWFWYVWQRLFWRVALWWFWLMFAPLFLTMLRGFFQFFCLFFNLEILLPERLLLLKQGLMLLTDDFQIVVFFVDMHETLPPVFEWFVFFVPWKLYLLVHMSNFFHRHFFYRVVVAHLAPS